MIKICKIISSNEKISVVLFDDIKVQIPSENVSGKVAYVKFEAGKYFVSTKEEFEKSNTNIKKKQSKKMTTETVEENNETDKIL